MVATRYQSVVILGDTSGIELAAALALRAAGYRVIATGRDATRADRVRKTNPDIHIELADAASVDYLHRLYLGLQRFDHLVLCISGAKGAGPFASLALDELRAGFEAKFFSQFLAAKLALPHLAKTGSVTFVSAISARAANPGTVGLAAINGTGADCQTSGASSTCLSFTDLSPKFLAFYDQAVKEHASPDQRWELWQKLYHFAASSANARRGEEGTRFVGSDLAQISVSSPELPPDGGADS